jgi:hypothetical protein
MIGWLQSVDVWLFRLINESWSNRLFDWLMPFLSDSPWFACVLILIALGLVVKGGARGRVCVLMLALALCLGNWLVGDSIKHAVGRLRPFHVIMDAHLRIGMGDSFSMPSSHAANWFSATIILLVYYRRSIWCMLPLAVGGGSVKNLQWRPLSQRRAGRGAMLGAGYSAAVMWGGRDLAMDRPRWFSIWWERMPSLLNPVVREAKREFAPAVARPCLRNGCAWVTD